MEHGSLDDEADREYIGVHLVEISDIILKQRKRFFWGIDPLDRINGKSSGTYLLRR